MREDKGHLHMTDEPLEPEKEGTSRDAQEEIEELSAMRRNQNPRGNGTISAMKITELRVLVELHVPQRQGSLPEGTDLNNHVQDHCNQSEPCQDGPMPLYR